MTNALALPRVLRSAAWITFSVTCGLAAESTPTGAGLSLFFRNGQMAPLTFYGNPPRYLQEIDIVTTSASSTTDNGLQPLTTTGDFANLDWTGVKQVEEEWKPSSNGTFTRVRYFRNAVWMLRRSQFTLQPVTAAGASTGPALTADAGWDDRPNENLDDGWVRRFVARQIATNCPASGNCTGATFVAQALVQFRDAMRPGKTTRTLAADAAALELRWSESNVVYRVPVAHAAAAALPYGYGFSPVLQAVNPPANGRFYTPGEQVQLRITLRDGSGRRLHPAGSLPTYRQVTSGQDTSGIRYYDPTLQPQLYYALKHREGNSMVTLAGPTNKMTTAKELGAINIFTPEVITATVPNDGFSASIVGFPPFSVTRGTAPADTPVSDVVTFHIPADALPGTYVAALKSRREFSGEALNRGATLSLQVGTTSTTGLPTKVGQCQECHEGRSDLKVVLHGLPDRRACAGCHNGSTFVGAYDVRVHTIHSRSRRFDENFAECTHCHTSTPASPARGALVTH